MSAVLPHYKTGPANYQVSALIYGGQLVAPTTRQATATTTTDLSVIAAGGSTRTTDADRVLGVAGNDANVLATQTGAANTYGQSQIDISVLTDYVSVYYGPVDILVWYSTAAAYGELLICSVAANAQGTVAAAGAMTPGTFQYNSLVARCTNPGGVAAPTVPGPWPSAANAVLARARLLV